MVVNISQRQQTNTQQVIGYTLQYAMVFLLKSNLRIWIQIVSKLYPIISLSYDSLIIQNVELNDVLIQIICQD